MAIAALMRRTLGFWSCVPRAATMQPRGRTPAPRQRRTAGVEIGLGLLQVRLPKATRFSGGIAIVKRDRQRPDATVLTDFPAAR